jgi:hypothetical protein
VAYFRQLALAFFWERLHLITKSTIQDSNQISSECESDVLPPWQPAQCMHKRCGITTLDLQRSLKDANVRVLSRSWEMPVTCGDPQVDRKPSFIVSLLNRKFSSAFILCSPNRMPPLI